MAYDYPTDCIHLKACRRLCKLSRKEGTYITRGCNEKCSAYETLESFMEENSLYYYDDVQHAINMASEDGARGYTDNIVSDYL